MEFPTQLLVDPDTRTGRMLAGGDVRITVEDSNVDGHITIRFKAIFDNRCAGADNLRPRPEVKRNWLRVPYDEATHVFVEVPNAGGDYPDKVGTFYPNTGKWFSDKQADMERIGAAAIAANWINGAELTPGIDCHPEANCGVCGKVLTDPESIERGIGPECYKEHTSSHHQTKRKQLRFPSKTPEPSPFMVNKVLAEIDTLSIEDQEEILNALTLRLDN